MRLKPEDEASAKRKGLIDAACEAEETFGVDECERYAEELRKKKKKIVTTHCGMFPTSSEKEKP